MSSVNGVLDSIDTFRAIERGVDERKRDDGGETLAGVRVADMRTGRFRMQADETGIVPEFYRGPEASGTHETLAPPEENTEARLWGATPSPPRTSERETVEPEALRVTNETPETRRA